MHASAGGGYLPQGNVTIHVRVSDPDYDVSASGEDKIADGTRGPIKVTVLRGQADVVIATAGAENANARQIIDGKIAPEYGPITEIAPDSLESLKQTLAIGSTVRGPDTDDCPTNIF